VEALGSVPLRQEDGEDGREDGEKGRLTARETHNERPGKEAPDAYSRGFSYARERVVHPLRSDDHGFRSLPRVLKRSFSRSK
jgi:hypothetical protein